MSFIVTTNIIIIFLGYLSKSRKLSYLYELSFIMIFMITAFRFDFGTDYLNYYHMFYQISSSSNLIDLIYTFNLEYGWLLLNYLFKELGFFTLIVFISGYLTFVYYYLIKRYVHRHYYWLALFIYLFYSDIMLIQLSALRQAISISLFMISIHIFLVYSYKRYFI